MEIFSNLRGTLRSLFQLGRSGPQLKGTDGIEARDAIDNNFVVVRGLAPVAANDFVTKGFLDGANFRKRLTANATTTTTTAAATALTFPVKAGEAWQFEYRGTVQCSAAGGMKYSIGAPAGSTIEAWLETTLAAITTSNKQRIATVNTLTSTAVHIVANVPAPDTIQGVLVAGADGAVTLNIASVTNGSTTTLLLNSYLLARKIS